MEFNDTVGDINPKSYGFENMQKGKVYGGPHYKNTCIKTRFKTNRKYRSFVRMELKHHPSVEDYIMPSYFRNTRNWGDCEYIHNKIH